MSQFLGRFTLAAMLAGFLGGCVSGAGAIVDTIRTTAFGAAGQADQVALNPNYRYLRVTVAGRVVLLALGYSDSTPDGIDQVWYSAEREVVRLRDGRISGATGLTREWQSVSIPPMKTWKELASTEGTVHWTRTRDVQPGYRFNVVDYLALRRTEVPQGIRLIGMDARKLIWFEERMLSTSIDRPGSTNPTDAILPAARYAIEANSAGAQVVYAEQCIALDLCLTWQAWTSEQQAAMRR